MYNRQNNFLCRSLAPFEIVTIALNQTIVTWKMKTPRWGVSLRTIDVLKCRCGRQLAISTHSISRIIKEELTELLHEGVQSVPRSSSSLIWAALSPYGVENWICEVKNVEWLLGTDNTPQKRILRFLPGLYNQMYWRKNISSAKYSRGQNNLLFPDFILSRIPGMQFSESINS